MMKLRLLQRVRDLSGYAKELPGNQMCTNKPVPVAVSDKGNTQEVGLSPPTTNG